MQSNSYSIRKQNRQNVYDSLDILRAFSDKQFEEWLEKHPKIKEAREKKEKQKAKTTKTNLIIKNNKFLK